MPTPAPTPYCTTNSCALCDKKIETDQPVTATDIRIDDSLDAMIEASRPFLGKDGRYTEHLL